MQTTPDRNMKEPHLFAPDGSVGVKEEPLCSCGLNDTYSIHDPELVKQYMPAPNTNQVLKPTKLVDTESKFVIKINKI